MRCYEIRTEMENYWAVSRCSTKPIYYSPNRGEIREEGDFFFFILFVCDMICSLLDCWEL